MAGRVTGPGMASTSTIGITTHGPINGFDNHTSIAQSPAAAWIKETVVVGLPSSWKQCGLGSKFFLGFGSSNLKTTLTEEPDSIGRIPKNKKTIIGCVLLCFLS